MEYLPLVQKDNIVLTYGRQDTIIVTGWLSPNRTADIIHQRGENFVAIGNLYSQTPGVNFLVRNLLYNPQITHVIALECTQQDKVARSIRALLGFFEVGVREDYTVDVVGVTCEIDREIPREVLDDLRRRVKLTVIKNLADFSVALPQTPIAETSADRLEFPSPSNDRLTVYPVTKTGQSFRAKNLTGAWLKVLDYVSRFGVLTPNRFGGSTKECLAVNVTIENDDVEYPDFCPMDEGQCNQYIEGFLGKDREENSAYTYAERMRFYFGADQIQDAIYKLTKSPTARGVVINLWDSSSDIVSAEPPCLNHIWLRNTGGKLFMSATFRSHDMFSAWYPNAKALRALQHHIAAKVSPSLDVGELTVISLSAHVYEHNYNQIELLIDKESHHNETYDDSVGNFVISVTDRIYVDWLSSQGKKFYTFKGRKALLIGRDIYENVPHIDPTHLMYLGVELSRAERCLNQQLKYVQDDNITK